MTDVYGKDPQLKLLLLSQRLTALKRQREYNLHDQFGEDVETPNVMETEAGNDYSDDENEGDEDDKVGSRSSSKSSDDENGKWDELEGEGDCEKVFCHYDHGSTVSVSRECFDEDEDYVARTSCAPTRSVQEAEEETDDDGLVNFKPVVSLKDRITDKHDTPEVKFSQNGIAFSRLADFYRHPESLHDIRKPGVIDLKLDDDDDCPINGTVSEGGETGADEMKRSASADDSKKLRRQKSATNPKLTRTLKSGLKLNTKETLSERLLDISDDANQSSDSTLKLETLFHKCVCVFPWKCVYCTEYPSEDVLYSERSTKVSHLESVRGREDPLIGWGYSKNNKGNYGIAGRKVSSARDSNRRRKCDPFSNRYLTDSGKYTFKHYQDWEAYVDEYRRYYTVGQTGTAMKSHPVPEGGGRREAVVIVRTLSESLIRPRLQEYNIPDWDDFTDLSAAHMRPLHIGARSGKVPDLGVTWLAAAAAPAHHREVPAEYRHPANRHIKLTNIRNPETMATQIKKRNQQALVNSSLSSPRVGPILPHDAGVKIPVEPMHIVEDFRKGTRKDKRGADMHPIGCRFLASWRPNDSTRVKSAKSRSKRGHIDGKQAPLQPLTNGQSQTRAGLLKLFSPPKGLDIFGVQSGSDSPSLEIEVAQQPTKVKGRVQPSATSVDASKWTNLPASAEKSSTEKQRSSKSRAYVPPTDKRSATRSGTLVRKPTARLHQEAQPPQTDLLHVVGESKKDRSHDADNRQKDIPQMTASPEKDGCVFAKARIKLIAPFAQPLTQDNVLVGSPYMAGTHFGKEEPTSTAQSTGGC